MERPAPIMRRIIEQRALRPPTTPNGNPDVPPSSVGEDVDEPGSVEGVQFLGDFAPATFTHIVPSPWSGWPLEWSTPQWSNRVGELTDIAWSCLDLNASVIASMPPYLVGASPSLPIDWLANPDPDLYTSWEEFANTLLWDFQLGEAFVLCTARYSNGYPARFHVVEPWTVNVEMDGPRRDYRIGEWRVPAGDMLHLRYKSTSHDPHGHGPLEVGKYRLIAANALARYATTLVSGGGVAPGVLEVERELTVKQSTDLQAQWHNAEALGLIRVLSGGNKYNPVQMSPRDMALVDLEQINAARIADLLKVPPFLVALPSGGDSLTYSTTESLFDFHWRAGLRTKVARVFPALSAWLTPRGTRLEVNRDEYIKPGPLVRAQVAQMLHGIVDGEGPDAERALTVAEIRRGERLNETSPSPINEGVLQ